MALDRRLFVSRTCLSALGALLLNCAAGAQVGGARKVGILMSYAETDAIAKLWLQAFYDRLKSLFGNDAPALKLQTRWGLTPTVLRSGAIELLAWEPEVLLAGATPAALILKDVNRSTPVVFTNVADPVGQNIVSSLAHPGENMSGFGAFEFSLGGKWVQKLSELSPSIKKILILYNAETAPFYKSFLPSIFEVSNSMRIETILKPIDKVESLQGIVRTVKSDDLGAIVLPGARFTNARAIVIEILSAERVPVIYPYSYYARQGGLASYGFAAETLYAQAAEYVFRVMHGQKIGSLPVQHPIKTEFIINIFAAKKLAWR
ncbi:ABC transporter substrate-binding protein [Methylobacterium phyllosphaerae]